MSERCPSLTVRTPKPTHATTELLAAHCWPHCSAARSLLDSSFALRIGWLRLRRAPPTGSSEHRALDVRRYRRRSSTLTRLGISAALALALFGQPSGSAGAGYGPLGAAFRVNTTIPGSQRSSAIAADAQGNYVVAWEGNDGFSLINDIYAQRYSSSGAPL